MTEPTDRGDSEGLIRDKLPRWLCSRLGAADVTLTSVVRMSGGYSNETWEVSADYRDDAGGWSTRFILRWGAEGGVSAPYDIPRQFALLKVLEPVGVMSPPPLWLEPSRELLGEQFLTMRTVPGVTGPRYFPVDDPARDRKLRSYVAALARIHALDWRSLGIQEILPAPAPEDCAAVALSNVTERLRRRGCYDYGEAQRALAWLSEQAPQVSDVRLVHGDPNVSNYRYDENSEVVAVIDWDMAMLSDPMWDVGFYCGAIPKFYADQPESLRARERDAFLQLYSDATGRSLDKVEFWEVLFTLFAAAGSQHPGLGDNRSPIYWQRLAALT